MGRRSAHGNWHVNGYDEKHIKKVTEICPYFLAILRYSTRFNEKVHSLSKPREYWHLKLNLGQNIYVSSHASVLKGQALATPSTFVFYSCFPFLFTFPIKTASHQAEGLFYQHTFPCKALVSLKRGGSDVSKKGTPGKVATGHCG